MQKKAPFTIFPTYSDIFSENSQKVIDQLSKEGLAEKLIIYSTSLSGFLYKEHIQGYSAQAHLMTEFKDVLCNTCDGRKILEWMALHQQNVLNINEFTMMSLYQLLLNHRKGKCLNLAITEEEKLLYLKLMLIANEARLDASCNFNFKESLQQIAVNDVFLYEKLFWPILLAETDVNETISLEYEMFRLKSVVDYVESSYPEAKEVIHDFFIKRGFDDYKTYTSCFSLIYLDYFANLTNNNILKTGIADNNSIKALLLPLTINATASVDNYLQLKSHPLYYYDNAYYVINWSYFLNHIYIGTFKELECVLAADINGIKDFKQETGTIIEKTLFKKVFENSFGTSWQKSSFDNCNGALPDAMFQIGNHLFVVELKDSLMAERTVESFDFKNIEKHIRETFIEVINYEKNKTRKRKKGISQLASYIVKYRSGLYKDFPYNPKLNIYPILVYTDYKYRLNGLNHYLASAFEKIVTEDKTLSLIKRRIHPLTVIGLDTLFNLQIKLREKKLKLADVIDDYHRHNKKSFNKYADRGVERYSQLYPSFERYLPECREIFLSISDFQTIFKTDFFHIKSDK